MELRPVEQDPFNAETPLAVLDLETVPNELFYVRNHFGVPSGDEPSWRLRASGETLHEFTLADLRELPYQEVAVTMECAGNGRVLMDPTPTGIPWGWGAVATARFGGTLLSNILEMAGIQRTQPK